MHASTVCCAHCLVNICRGLPASVVVCAHRLVILRHAIIKLSPSCITFGLNNIQLIFYVAIPHHLCHEHNWKPRFDIAYPHYLFLHTMVNLCHALPTLIDFSKHIMVSRRRTWCAIIAFGMHNIINHRKTYFDCISFCVDTRRLTSDVGYQDCVHPTYIGLPISNVD